MNLEEAYKIYKTEPGEIVLLDLMNAVEIEQTPFEIENGDPYRTAFRCGQQSIVKYIAAQIGYSEIDLIKKLVHESVREGERNDRRMEE